MSDKVGYLDGNGRLYVADSDREIVIMLADTEWGDTPPPLEWKERVRMRARVFDFEIEFHVGHETLKASCLTSWINFIGFFIII